MVGSTSFSDKASGGVFCEKTSFLKKLYLCALKVGEVSFVNAGHHLCSQNRNFLQIFNEVTIHVGHLVGKEQWEGCLHLFKLVCSNSQGKENTPETRCVMLDLF